MPLLSLLVKPDSPGTTWGRVLSRFSAVAELVRANSSDEIWDMGLGAVSACETILEPVTTIASPCGSLPSAPTVPVWGSASSDPGACPPFGGATWAENGRAAGRERVCPEV